MFGVRYIAINDNVDTDNSESSELMPFKNLFNERLIRDTSRKIRAVQRARAERGERLGTRAPYGYRKDEQKKLVIDEKPPPWCAESSPYAPPDRAPARSLGC